MINFRMLKATDPIIWYCLIFLLITSFSAIFSVNYAWGTAQAFQLLGKQFGALIIGVIGMAIFAYFDYRHLKLLAIPLYLIMMVLLVYVLFRGSVVSGASRWIHLGFFSFQPSEITKLVVILALAAYFDQTKEKAKILPALIIACIPFLLIFKQPDLGTALVIVAISLGMLVWNKTSPVLLVTIATPIFSLIIRPNLYLWLVYILVLWGILYFSRLDFVDLLLVMAINIGVGIAFPLIWGMLREYQRMRIVAFINPGIDPHGLGYHTMQSLVAVGSGGIFGRGFLHGSQTQLHFIPEQHSDFIFSSIAEEFGMIGAGLVIFALITLIRRAYIIADESADYFGGILVCGAATMLGFHAFLSIGMVLGVMPVVGIPLPFVSFGGTALIVDMILIGIIQNVAMRRQKLIF